MSVNQDQVPTQKKSAGTGSGTLFVCAIKPEAKTVYLVGEFNRWDHRATRMVKRQGKFQTRLELKPGEYQYKFLVDGEWHADPNAEQVQNEFGTTNNVIRV